MHSIHSTTKMISAQEECVQYNIIPREVSLVGRDTTWEELCNRMMKILWSDTDILLPQIDDDSYHNIITNLIPIVGVDIRYALTLTNFIDSIVGTIIKTSSTSICDKLKGYKFYDKLDLYLMIQSVSEKTHEIVYKTQFDAIVPADMKDSYTERIQKLLIPISTILTKETGVLLGTLIESIIIPLVFCIINDFRDVIQTDSKIANEILTTIVSANRFILKDELTHILGGINFIKHIELYSNIKILDQLDEMMNRINIVASNLIDESVYESQKERYNQIKNDLISITYNQLKQSNKNVSIDQYINLPFISSAIPSLEGFFHGTFTSYSNYNKDSKFDATI